MPRIISGGALLALGGRVAIRHLTVKERIQLHLFDYARFAEAYEAPPEVTQERIAHAAGIRIPHVRQYLRPLIAEGLIEERTSHIQRSPRRRRAYFLTPRGRFQAASLRSSILKEEVPLRTRSGGLESLPIARIYQEERRGASLLDLLRELESLGHVTEAPEVERAVPVDLIEEAPRADRFYGREDELISIARALDGKPVVVVTGMAGIGKSTLAAKLCERMRGQRSLFWRTIRPWDTAMDLASRLAIFLKDLGHGELHGQLVGRGTKELGPLEDLFARDLAGLRAVLVLDDVHNASADARAFLSIILKALKRQSGTSALLLSRTVPDVYSRREVDVESSVVEVPLRGLDRVSCVSLLSEAGIADPLLGSLVEACGGSPLFLRLLASAGPHGGPAERWKTLETYIAEEIEPGLEDEERGCLEVASLYHLPVSSRGLLLVSWARTRTLVSLRRKGLLTPTDSDRYLLHDALRSYFHEGLSSQRKTELVSLVAPWLLREALEAQDRGRPHEAIAYLGNAVVVEVDPARRVANLQRLGDLRRHVGDYPGALEAYQAALRGVEDPPIRARVHQKIALCLEVQGDLKGAEQEIGRGLELVPSQPSLEAAWLLYQGASIAYERQDYDGVLREVDRVTHWMPGLPEDPELWGDLANLRGLVHLYDPRRVDYALAQADFEEAIRAWGSVNYKRGLCQAHNNLFLAALELGKGEKALEYLDRAASVADSIGDVPNQETALFTKAWFLTEYRGDYLAAEALYRETYRLAKETHQRNKIVWHHYHFAHLYRRQGRNEEARESLEYFLTASESLLSPENRIEAWSLMARLCLLCGDSKAAESALAEAERLATASPSDYASHAVEWARAALFAAREDSAVAAGSYERALKLLPAMSSLAPRGEFLLDYGRFLSSTDDASRAQQVLAAACTELAKTSPPLERMARDLLQKAGSPGAG